jgi:diadenosine tetraphosphatase ApaH/serine/threonine PP2A family protein phosphatase
MGTVMTTPPQATRYLVIADVHANLEALEAVLDDAPDFDAAICLGDTVGYGANPNECVERVRELPNLTCLAGNHDLAALGRVDLDMFNDYARAAAVWTSRNLADDTRAFLDALPPALNQTSWYLAHASPRDPVWEYMEYDVQGPPNFERFEQSMCFVGHTHVPRVFLEDPDTRRADVAIPRPGSVMQTGGPARAIVNPGGVGQPRDHDPRAAYGLLDAGSGEFAFRRVSYPVAEAQKKIESAGLPEPLAYRLAIGV